MKTILSYIIFYLSFGLFIYCLFLGSDADKWLMISTIALSVTGIILDTSSLKDKK